jgi:hypothetical protein
VELVAPSGEWMMNGPETLFRPCRRERYPRKEISRTLVLTRSQFLRSNQELRPRDEIGR